MREKVDNYWNLNHCNLYRGFVHMIDRSGDFGDVRGGEEEEVKRRERGRENGKGNGSWRNHMTRTRSGTRQDP